MSDCIGIIGAMDIEVETLISEISDRTEKTVSGIRFVSGKLENKNVVIAKCGIGKVFAGICAQTMILEYSPKIIINTGVAGAIQSGIHIFDTVVADKVVQHDMDTSAIGDPKGLISGINKIYIEADKNVYSALKEASQSVGNNAIVGTIASGDKFISENSDKEFIKKEFNALACEMEGAAIGQVCYINNVAFGIIRAISDGDGAQMDYKVFAVEAAQRSIKTVKKFIEII